jgi:hypothetical protein
MNRREHSSSRAGGETSLEECIVDEDTMADDVFPSRQARIPASNSYGRALAAAISRHYSDTEVADTVEQALEALARACWEHAGRTVSPFEDDRAARALILKALRSVAGSDSYHHAWRVFEKGAASFGIPGTSKKTPEEPQFNRTVLLMSRCLWETWMTDDSRRCPAGSCQHINKCPDAGGAACARTVVFPYLTEVEGERVDDHPPGLVRVPNFGRTATAIVTGMTPLNLPFSVNAESVRKRLLRRE